jgi:protein farnesyltransferase/geranylgeranyltransferase type-1 subunit alpha
MGKYSDNPAWVDVVPLPQEDLVPTPLANINYPDDYAEATSYLRAIMAANEMSPRVLDLTADIINMSAAHYTVW